jgi:prophage antirepressor-like protein
MIKMVNIVFIKGEAYVALEDVNKILDENNYPKLKVTLKEEGVEK